MTTEAAASPSIWERMIRAAKLDVTLYEEVEHDSSTNGQAFIVVLLAGLATGIGAGIAGGIEEGGLSFLWGLFIGVGTGILGWLVWSLITYLIGITIFRGPETEATYGQLLRTLGFASSVGVLRFFVFIPFLGWLIGFVAFVWMLVAGVIAVRQALDFSTGRAIGTCIVGWLVYFLLTILLSGVILGAASLF